MFNNIHNSFLTPVGVKSGARSHTTFLSGEIVPPRPHRTLPPFPLPQNANSSRGHALLLLHIIRRERTADLGANASLDDIEAQKCAPVTVFDHRQQSGRTVSRFLSFFGCPVFPPLGSGHELPSFNRPTHRFWPHTWKHTISHFFEWRYRD